MERMLPVERSVTLYEVNPLSTVIFWPFLRATTLRVSFDAEIFIDVETGKKTEIDLNMGKGKESSDIDIEKFMVE